MSSVPDLQLQRFLPYKLSRLLNAVSDGLYRTYAPRFDLNVSQWRMLAAVAQLQPTSVTELTDYSGMDKVTISRAIREMVDRKLVRRELVQRDRRRSMLTLTDEGERIYREIAPAALRFERTLVSALRPDELEQLHSMVDRLIDRIAIMQLGSDALIPQDVRETGRRFRPKPPPLRKLSSP